MIIAVTGGTGFIGRNLVLHHLALGDEVRVLSRRSLASKGLPDSVKWYCGDLTCSEDLQSFVDQVDVLYHCAGEIRDEALMSALHVDGTRELIGAATGKIGRWVQLSSVGVYGFPQCGAITEASQHRPTGVYEVTKKQSDDLVVEAGMGGAFEWAILRPSIVFGEQMANQSLFQMIKVIDKKMFFFIGRPGASANYIHVDNVVYALSLCASLPQATGKIFNLSDYVTLEAFVEMIASALGKNRSCIRLPVIVTKRISRIGTLLSKRFPLTESRINAMTTRVVYPIDSIQTILGYSHKVPMAAGVTRLVQSWQISADIYRPIESH